MITLYRTPAMTASQEAQVASDASRLLGRTVKDVSTEWCFYIQTASKLTGTEEGILRWLLAETFEPINLSARTFLGDLPTVCEVGPRLNFETAWSTTAVAIARACRLSKVVRIERAARFGLDARLSESEIAKFLAPLHDRMTQVQYARPLSSFRTNRKPKPVETIDVKTGGKDVLRKFSEVYGCGWDDYDIEWIYNLFHDHLKTNPTDVVLFQIAQSITAEHSRHGFFKGRHIIDGCELGESLMDIVKAPWKANPGNSSIAFGDDSSAMRGRRVTLLVPLTPGMPGPVGRVRRLYDPTLTAETHCHPTFIEPFEGSATGTGGRLRDNQCVGRGGLIIAGALGILTGNLCIPGYKMPWEDEEDWRIPEEFATPLQIMLRGTGGAYAYGNCFGEPTILGVTRTFGQTVSGERRGWYKPILYTAGWGQMDSKHRKKGKPMRNMLVVQVGGKAFRIGMGGGSSSSLSAGAISAKLAFDSVQRGGPEMENRLNRVISACVAMGAKNPIVSAHDYGAGGACNALTEIICPAGARIELRRLPVGDKTLSVLEIWGNEAQERDAFLIRPRDWNRFKRICDREKAECAIVGRITGDGWLVLHDESDGNEPVKVPLDKLLIKFPQKTFRHPAVPPSLSPLNLPKGLSIKAALARVLRLPAVASKRFLTAKVDRSVGGLVAQQQCVGPNQLPLSDFAVIAQTYFPLSDQNTPGVAMSLGEQPVKGLIDPEKMSRLAVAEALLNLAGAKITRIQDVKMSANWMWAAKRPGEGPNLIAAAQALRDYLIPLGAAIDGGKDSLSMSARIFGPNGEPQEAKAPGELVLSFYAPMPDVARKVTCELKRPGNTLIYLDLSDGRKPLGGSALAQCFGQIGNDCPDAASPEKLARAFAAVQHLVESDLVSAIHDVSDGGLITALLEMAFAGNLGLELDILDENPALNYLFSEGPGLVLETGSAEDAGNILFDHRLNFEILGSSCRSRSPEIKISFNGKPALTACMTELRAIWEETGCRLDSLQANPACAKQEAETNSGALFPPPYLLTFEPEPTPEYAFRKASRPSVAVIREQGTNGDAEMRAAMYSAGFRVWDVAMSDLVENRVTLDRFQGIVFPGGFSFGDVLDAGKGWAGVIRFNPKVREQFERFRMRSDTFSFGVCNGCQLMALMGWVPGWDHLPEAQQPRFVQNRSRRFESRWSAVTILESPAVMLSGMSGSTLGVWVAHGEGYLHVPKNRMLKRITDNDLAPIRYVNLCNRPTEAYPENPNGSPQGIAGLCSPDGRHLAMMPHPERAFKLWQWPWLPEDWKGFCASPWLKLFQNAYHWCANL